MSERTPRAAGRGQPKRAETPREALERARVHALRAASESLRALEALVDAGTLATTGRSGEQTPWTRAISAALRELADLLAQEHSGEALVAALSGALDAEIARWEGRARQDPDARAVLRAYLGVRELLWELGLRAPEAGSPPAPRARRPKPRPKPVKAPERVSRVPVEG